MRENKITVSEIKSVFGIHIGKNKVFYLFTRIRVLLIVQIVYLIAYLQ